MRTDVEARFFPVAAIAGLGSLLLGFLPHSNWWWGMNLLRFYPAPVRIAWVVAILTGLAAVRFLPRRDPKTGERPPAFRALPIPVTALVAALFSGLVFHLLRARSFLLGDGTHIVIHLARHEPPAPRAALYNVLETGLVTALRGTRNIPTLGEAGFLSTVVGIVLVGATVWILLKRARSGSPAAALAAAALVLLQPSMQLFFGYVEAYALLAAPLILFFLLAQDVVEKRRSVWSVAAPAATALVAHPFGATTLPAFLLLLTGSDRRRALRRLVAALAVFAGAVVLLFFLFVIWPAGRSMESPVRFLAPQEYNELLKNVVRNIFNNPHWARRYNSWSPAHWADVVNQFWLTAAPAIIVLVALALARSGRRALATFPVGVVFAGTAGVLLIRMFLRTVLGAVRDWDLFAVTGIGITAIAATALSIWAESTRRRDLEQHGRTTAAPARMTLNAMLISLFFLVPWIGMQLDVDRAAQRHLAVVDAKPELEAIAAGDYHAAMGDRFFFIGQFALAGRAYDRAYQIWPLYMHALRAGQAYLAAGQLEKAALAMHRALKEHPDDRTAMAELGNILNGLNAFSLADSVLKKTIALYPDMPVARLHRTRTLAMLGYDREARAMLESARPLLKPGDPSLHDFAHLDSLIPGGPVSVKDIPAPPAPALLTTPH